MTTAARALTANTARSAGRGRTGVTARVAKLNKLASGDPQAAQAEVWAWFARLGQELPAATADDELGELFAAGTPADVDGETEGMLVGFRNPTGLDRAGGAVLPIVKSFVRIAPRLPWLGKKFDKKAQRGTNAVTGLAVAIARVIAPRYSFTRVGDHYEGFEMLNRVEESVVSPGTQVLVLDYESAEVANPWPINRIRDEAVQVVPGTYLGAKIWHQGNGYRQLAWWAARSPMG